MKQVIIETSRRQKTITDDIKNFNNIIRKSNNVLNESDIENMVQWLEDSDCAFIAASRKVLKDIRDKNSTYLGPDNDWEEGKVFTYEENREKNRLLVAELTILGYGTTKIKGVCPEGMTDECSEECYFVVNRNNDENFLDKLLRIAEFHNQDSIYYKEKEKTMGYLIGINTTSNYMSRLGDKAFSFVGEIAEKAENCAKAMLEFVNFWRKITEGRMLIKEDIHPLTRLVMGQTLRRMKENKVK